LTQADARTIKTLRPLDPQIQARQASSQIRPGQATYTSPLASPVIRPNMGLLLYSTAVRSKRAAVLTSGRLRHRLGEQERPLDIATPGRPTQVITSGYLWWAVCPGVRVPTGEDFLYDFKGARSSRPAAGRRTTGGTFARRALKAPEIAQLPAGRRKSQRPARPARAAILPAIQH
jgi:hypothetical protein